MKFLRQPSQARAHVRNASQNRGHNLPTMLLEVRILVQVGCQFIVLQGFRNPRRCSQYLQVAAGRGRQQPYCDVGCKYDIEVKKEACTAQYAQLQNKCCHLPLATKKRMRRYSKNEQI